MRKPLMMCAVVTVVASAFATTATYDDIDLLRPAGDVNEFWTTSGHPGATIDYCDSTPAAIDAMTQTTVVESAGTCDLRWIVFGLSSVIDFDSYPVGGRLIFR